MARRKPTAKPDTPAQESATVGPPNSDAPAPANAAGDSTTQPDPRDETPPQVAGAGTGSPVATPLEGGEAQVGAAQAAPATPTVPDAARTDKSTPPDDGLVDCLVRDRLRVGGKLYDPMDPEANLARLDPDLAQRLERIGLVVIVPEGQVAT